MHVLSKIGHINQDLILSDSEKLTTISEYLVGIADNNFEDEAYGSEPEQIPIQIDDSIDLEANAIPVPLLDRFYTEDELLGRTRTGTIPLIKSNTSKRQRVFDEIQRTNYFYKKCTMTNEALARNAGCSKSTVEKTLRILQKERVVYIINKFGQRYIYLPSNLPRPKDKHRKPSEFSKIVYELTTHPSKDIHRKNTYSHKTVKKFTGNVTYYGSSPIIYKNIKLLTISDKICADKDFQKIYKAYPRKDKKEFSWEAWELIRNIPGIMAIIMTAIDNHKKRDFRFQGDMRYIPRLSTFLRSIAYNPSGGTGEYIKSQQKSSNRDLQRCTAPDHITTKQRLQMLNEKPTPRKSALSREWIEKLKEQTRRI